MDIHLQPANRRDHASAATIAPVAHDEHTTTVPGDALVAATGLRRTYGKGATRFEAVRGVDLAARRGELFGLLGTNGAGKTSTLEVLEGLARPSGGRVRVCSEDPYTRRRTVRPRIGIMLQEAGFPSDMTVTEAGRMWAGTMAAPRPVAEALGLVDLGHRAGVAVQNLSGGERRRLDLALAIMGRPEVLFLDEPTTGLDPESRAGVWDLLRHLLDQGTCIVLTTHYLEEAERLADHLAIMHEGRIVRHGTLAEVVAGQPSRVEFVPPAGLGPVPAFAGVDVGRDGDRVVLRTPDLQATLGEVLAWAGPTTLPGLRASTASLEQVFLDVAGRSDSVDSDSANASAAA
ncbi:ABC transporter ATP-binding protein [Agilicoccus flavus]|uniref:ABC transporter ATP-binding protein n=1 Tax=Agilicoccus flavus TaxID=2775968 RepID=UPI001CF695F2|nr:ABC transporter ATP-binding protein [Agilicoccus flavus]